MEVCIETYQKHLKEGAYFSSYVSLGEILHVIQYYSVRQSLKQKSIFLIESQLSQKKINDLVVGEFKKNFEHLKHIISIGNKFLAEEFFQILTLRFELYLVKNLFVSKFLNTDSLGTIDEEIHAIASAKQNKKAYTGVVKKMKQSWTYIITNSPYDI